MEAGVRTDLNISFVISFYKDLNIYIDYVFTLYYM